MESEGRTKERRDLHQHPNPGAIVEEPLRKDGIIAFPLVDDEPFPDEECDPQTTGHRDEDDGSGGFPCELDVRLVQGGDEKERGREK